MSYMTSKECSKRIRPQKAKNKTSRSRQQRDANLCLSATSSTGSQFAREVQDQEWPDSQFAPSLKTGGLEGAVKVNREWRIRSAGQTGTPKCEASPATLQAVVDLGICLLEVPPRLVCGMFK